MAEYVVSSEDRATEAALTAYQQERAGVQSVGGQMYQAIVRTENAHVDLETKLSEGGQLAGLAGYHNAVSAPVANAVALLRGKMAEVTGLMVAMQAAMPEGVELFPGVPRE